jgi:hypothetical protein
MLYLKAAEIMNEGVCGVYELTYKRGDKRYRVFKSTEELETFLKKNKAVTCENFEPVYISKKHVAVADEQVRRLTKQEVTKYLEERKEQGISDKC